MLFVEGALACCDGGDDVMGVEENFDKSGAGDPFGGEILHQSAVRP